ncbi:hypothetical protein DYB32_010578, partial [Aphanomyces invadans]
MAEWKPRQVFNMGCLLASLLESDAMSLTCLKVVLDFTDLSPAAILFLKVVFEKLLSADDEAAVIGVIERMALHKVKVPGLRDGITVFLHQHMMPYKFKNLLGKVRAKMVAALLDVVGKKLRLRTTIDAAGATMHRRPLRKHQQAVASLASLHANLFNVHEPDILDLRDSGVTDYSHEFLHHDSDSDWVVLEWDDIMHPHASYVQIKLLLRQKRTFQEPPPTTGLSSKPSIVRSMHGNLVMYGPTTRARNAQSSTSSLLYSGTSTHGVDDAFTLDSMNDSEAASPTNSRRPSWTLSQSSFDKDTLNGVESNASAHTDNDQNALDVVVLRCRSFTHFDLAFVDDRRSHGRLYWVDQVQGDLGYVDLDSSECCVLLERRRHPSHIKVVGRCAVFIEAGSDDSSDGGSISCMNLDTNEVSVVVARLSNPVGLCAMNKTWLAFGQCVASARGRVLKLSAICNMTLAMRCPQPDSVRHLVTTALTSNAVEPTAMSVSESGVLCVGFSTTSSHVSTTTGALFIWIPSRKCTATDVFEYTVAMSIELATPHSVRDVVGHPSWPFFYFCMADDRAMAHAPALGQVDLRSSHPALLLDTERFIPSMCMAGTTDRLYYCARASSTVNITYAFDICEPSHGLPRQARATNGLTDTSNCVETNVSHDRSRVEDGQVKKIQVILRSRPLLPHELDRGVRS